VFRERRKVGYKTVNGWFCRTCGKWEFGADANVGQRRKRKSRKYLADQAQKAIDKMKKEGTWEE
jgi:hypothetical protein